MGQNVVQRVGGSLRVGRRFSGLDGTGLVHTPRALALVPASESVAGRCAALIYIAVSSSLRVVLRVLVNSKVAKPKT